MGRLIREDDVMRMLTGVELNNGTITDAKIELRNVKTAYDVDKVVAELEELANHYHKCCLVDYNEGAEVGVRETMAIVRKGGVE